MPETLKILKLSGLVMAFFTMVLPLLPKGFMVLMVLKLILSRSIDILTETMTDPFSYFLFNLYQKK